MPGLSVEAASSNPTSSALVDQVPMGLLSSAEEEMQQLLSLSPVGDLQHLKITDDKMIK